MGVFVFGKDEKLKEVETSNFKIHMVPGGKKLGFVGASSLKSMNLGGLCI